jgi:outer membrane protein assembly factor BamB
LSTNKEKTICITLFLMLSISALVSYLPTVNAADIETYPFLSVVPSTVGVGQKLQVTMWLSIPPPTLLEEVTLPGMAGIGQGQWHDFTVTVTKPGGTTETLGPFDSESTGSTYTLYTPEEVGNYTFQMSFPGERKNGTELFTFKPIDDYYKPSTTSKVTVTVQEEPIQNYPNWPLPTEYWERPIESENRDWWSISGNWLLERYNATGAFNPYTTAPNTAHIVWTKELAFGGATGGEFGSESYHEGHVYTIKLAPPVIINGRLYYNQPDPPRQGFYCVDLRTGEQLFYSNSSSDPTGTYQFWSSSGGTGGITCGQILNFDCINEHGTHAYLWNLGSPKYNMYDPFTGNVILSFDNVPLAAQYGGVDKSVNIAVNFDEKGNLLVYILDGTNNWLLMWNSTLAVYPTGTANWLQSESFPRTHDWSRGIQWNVTVPDLEGEQQFLGYAEPATINDEVLIATTWKFMTGDFDGKITDVAYSAKDGHQLWYQNRTVPSGATSFNAKGPVMNGIYCVFIKETMQWYGYDLDTGELVWGPSEAYKNAWGMYGGASATAAYGNFYASAFDGMIHAYNIKTGEHLWDFWTGDAGFETAYGTWPFCGWGGALTVADGKIYQSTGEHSADVPLWRGGGLYCVNATTGDLMWKIKGWYYTPVIADGYMVAGNGADNRIYCFGKGQTATTVSASPKVSVHGNSVLIEGTVLDESPGAAGTAAIADEYQTPWMEYLYMQKPYPSNATGVEVTLDVLDSNGNYRNIGTATSNANGFYSFAWEPDIPGKYTVIATFAGSESYWSSVAETAFNVEEAPQATPPPTPVPASAADLYFVPATIGIIIAIIIVGLVIVLMLRKR